MSTKLCVIAGVGPGIGLAVARRFAKEGFNIALLARNEAALQGFAQQLSVYNVKVGVYPTDLGDNDSVAKTFAQIKDELGEVEVLVYNAFNASWSTLADISPEDLQNVFNVNVVGAVRCYQQVLPDMKQRKGGVILLTGTGAAVRPVPFMPAYGSTKATLRMLGLNLAAELAPVGIHLAVVTVNGRVIADSPYPDAIADQFWALYEEKPDHWQTEIIVQPLSGTN